MTLQEFIQKYNGKYCEVAGSPQNQCVDLANAYLREVLGQPIVEWTNAIDFPSKLTANFDYILNTPTGVPQEGDLIISGVSCGHIGIFLEGDANRFTSFDQNYPTGSFCTVVEHNYNSPKVHGWLRLKSGVDLQFELDKCRIDRDKNWNYLIEIARLLNKETNITIIKEEIEKLIKLEDKVAEKDRQLRESSQKITEQDNQIKELGEQFSVLNDQYQQSKADFEDKSEEFLLQIKQANETIEQLKKDSEISNMDWWDLIKRGIEKLIRG